MDLRTTNKNTFRGDKAVNSMPKYKELEATAKPIQMSSSYKACFVDWNNGDADVFHEKHP